MKTILEESMGLRWAAIEREGKLKAIDQGGLMSGDHVYVWTTDRQGAREWVRAIREEQYREWSPTDLADNVEEALE